MTEMSPGMTLSRYRILSKLGEGGMGEVYLAADTKLDRRVALKILPQHMANDSERMRRFVQEAKAASALNHPNIITIYEISEIDNRHFIASEYIDGQTLHTKIKSGPMPLNTALDAAVQIATALQAAHEANIIHRDIKPQNVMVRPDGLVKLLDFGIAKVTAPVTAMTAHHVDSATTIKGGTSPGFIIGTAAYMSPEQARGLMVDARTDVFSFGVLFYEMLAGTKPFDGETAMDLIGAILHKEPLPISEHLPEIPDEIERIISKLLRKDSDERYQSIKDVLIDLKDVRKELEFQDKLKISVPSGRRRQKSYISSSTAETKTQQTNSSSAEYIVGEIRKHKVGAGAVLALLVAAVAVVYYFATNSTSSADNVPIASIAVLPFENKSADEETEYLSDGLAESLIYGLSQLPDLKVSPTSVVFRYKNKELDPIRIGAELGVNAVMTGRVAQRGEHLTISVELVDVRNKKLLWGKQYDHKLEDLLTTQREIATQITQNLKLKLSGADEKRSTRHYSKNSEAYQLYLKGHYYASRYTKEGFNKGIEYFERAIAKDPNFALAYSGLAFCYMNQTDWVFAPKDSVPKVRKALDSALKIDPSLPEAHTLLGMILLQYDWDWAGAEREFRRAIELNPDYALGRSFLAWHLAAMGRFDESITEDKRAMELDPLSAAINADLGWDLYLARRYDEAIEQLGKAVDLEPNYWLSHVLLGRCYVQKGKMAEAIAEFEKAVKIENSIPEVLASLAYGYGISGKRAEAMKILRELQDRSKKEFVPSYTIAMVYIGLGMKDEAIQNLFKGYEEGSFYNIHLKVEPVLDPVRDDARFADIVKRVGHDS